MLNIVNNPVPLTPPLTDYRVHMHSVFLQFCKAVNDDQCVNNSVPLTLDRGIVLNS
jgi:hypothetical protein